jgi:asparagine synthase (glutamine-hydrolysing)
MCGIWAALKAAGLTEKQALAYVKKLEPRGPEYTAVEDISGVLLGFTRLAINGLTPLGHQPFRQPNTATVCNGEIYNYKELATRWNLDLPMGTSDCAIIPHLATHLPPTELVRTLDGVFAFAHVNTKTNQLLVARDPYGVRPLFEAQYADGSTIWSSEIKAFPTDYSMIQPFPPGTWRLYNTLTGNLISEHKYHTVPHVKQAALGFPSGISIAKVALRESLISAVKKRLLSDRPIGALLSGGLDSSLIAAIAARELKLNNKKLHTFSIGMPGSTDLVYARMVADFIKSEHHEVVVTPEDFLNAIPQVIHDIESYDITTVRASVGNWLIGKYIKEKTDIKVVFNGDGSDEIGGGYLYFYRAPNDEMFEAESERLLNEIHLYDVLRSDRCMASHGLEARTPFLDKNVVATWRAIATYLRRPKTANAEGRGAMIEKFILREAFVHDHYVPLDVLMRKKEAFSDGVSATTDSWYLKTSEYAKTLNTTDQQATYAHNPPQTDEARWYRQLFTANYGDKAATLIPRMWLPRWIPGATDPSARTLKELY